MEWFGKSPATIPYSFDSNFKRSKPSSGKNRRLDSARRHLRRDQIKGLMPKEKYSNGYRSRFLELADPMQRGRAVGVLRPSDVRTTHPQKQFPRLNAIAPKTSGDLEDRGVCK